MTMMFRFTTMSAFALWIGGFTFYAFAVIPTGDRVLGTHTPVGFITQIVTGDLNFLGVVALSLAGVAMGHLHREKSLRPMLILMWLISAGFLTFLIALHARLDATLDNPNRTVLAPAQFYPLHEIYKFAYLPMWFASIALVYLLMHAWQRLDRSPQRSLQDDRYSSYS